MDVGTKAVVIKKGPAVLVKVGLAMGGYRCGGWTMMVRSGRRRALLLVGFGPLVDWGMVESPCGTPRPEGVVAVVRLLCRLTGDWWN